MEKKILTLFEFITKFSNVSDVNSCNDVDLNLDPNDVFSVIVG